MDIFRKNGYSDVAFVGYNLHCTRLTSYATMNQQTFVLTSFFICVIMIAVPVNIHLSKQNTTCRSETTNDPFFAHFVSFENGLAVYAYGQNQTCSFYTNVVIPVTPGSTVMLYKSDDGHCSMTQKSTKYCYIGLFVFNFLFWTFGSWIIFGSLLCFAKLIPLKNLSHQITPEVELNDSHHDHNRVFRNNTNVDSAFHAPSVSA